MLRHPVAAFVAAALACSAGCKDGGTITVRRLSFAGVNAVDVNRLKDALATRQSSTIPWGRKQFFDRSRFDADLKRIQAFYADRGFPDARVTGFDVRLNKTQDEVDLTVTIAEGEPVRVSAIGFSGFDVIPPAHLDDLRARVPLKVGQPRDRQLAALTREMAVNELKDHGFPYARVSTGEDAGSDGRQVRLRFTAEPGTLARFGPVEVIGNRSVGEHVIRREFTFKPGDLYRRSLVQEAQRRLYGLELFQFANVEALNQVEQPEAVPVRVTVAEGHHQRVNFGAGYGSDEKGRVDAEYHHVNFLGDARSAGVHARWSSLDRGVRADFNQPYFFAPRLSLGADGQRWNTYTPAYFSVVTGARVSVTYRARASTSVAGSIMSEHDVSSISDEALNDPALRNSLIALGLDPTTNEQNGNLNAVAFDARHSTTDNILNAHRGYQIATHAEQAGGIAPGSFTYATLSADLRHYLPLGDTRVFASRLQIGSIRPADHDQANIPFSKLYMLGGATSIRGWGRYEVSPLSDSGLPIGGDSMLALSGELRATLRGNLGGVLFLDAGNVWADPFGFTLGDLRYAVGAGLRYQTPVGPIRFDAGYQLNPTPDLIVNGNPQTRRFRLHVSIGQAF